MSLHACAQVYIDLYLHNYSNIINLQTVRSSTGLLVLNIHTAINNIFILEVQNIPDNIFEYFH
jgi:hypothetical protein